MWIFLFSQEILGLPSLGFGWIESLTFPGGGRCVGVGVLGRCLVWRWFCFFGSLWFFLLSSLGSWRRPVAGLGFGVLLVQLWVCGSTAVSAAPLVVPVPSSFFLRLYLNRPSTERKQFARRCPDAGVGRASLFFP